MYFRFDCVHCGKSLRIREEDAGRKAHCPYCRKQIRVPDAPGAAAAGSAAPAETSALARAAAQPAPQAPPGRTASETGASDGTNVNTLLSGVIGLAATVLFYLLLAPIRRTPLGDLFYGRGWVPGCMTDDTGCPPASSSLPPGVVAVMRCGLVPYSTQRA